MSELKLDMDHLRKRSFIYCPICCHRIYPLINGGIDDSMNGQWTCNMCENEFVFTFLGKVDTT